MQLYGNEREVGQAIRASDVERRDIFVTTKLWESEWGYREAASAIQDRLGLLDVGHIDLLLLHSPGNPRLRAETWQALESAQEQVFPQSTLTLLPLAQTQYGTHLSCMSLD